jgi:hypothetical protein
MIILQQQIKSHNHVMKINEIKYRTLWPLQLKTANHIIEEQILNAHIL